jgi:hypothetical protein
MDDGIYLDTTEFDGMAELLERFPEDIQDKLMQQSLLAGAQVLELGVISKCPTRLDDRTAKTTGAKAGWLKADIRLAQKKGGHGWLVGAGPLMAYLLRWLERGHRLVKGGTVAWSNGRKSRRGTGGQVIGHVPAYPILRPAFDEYVPTAVHAIAVELQAQIAEYWQQTLRRMKKVA